MPGGALLTCLIELVQCENGNANKPSQKNQLGNCQASGDSNAEQMSQAAGARSTSCNQVTRHLRHLRHLPPGQANQEKSTRPTIHHWVPGELLSPIVCVTHIPECVLVYK